MEKIKAKIKERIKNYKNNLALVKVINPYAVIFIETALFTLENEDLTNLKEKIDKIKIEVRKREKKNNKTLQLRARWGELIFLDRLIRYS
jgi:hypothetical protein